ncbi:ABC transporter ATP-binding protein [Falsirhodobacter sp. 20TX0035]|uniref:ABC transporter ATP-binding protein n=1 Tax=Falsirhodobacter sp. 20TX0035 TaxID=3022019 RepID=UPI00232AD04A|nr:oligopeptide/dipeptide ABC transporter ATP-binding protein [Falsirhodobacter sp. 20TX0035]MDB6454138.1 ATP-binding cassette domain-containing protein [Falsirhodobacter sp. 20TX0035]
MRTATASAGKHYSAVKAVDGVSFHIAEGETLCLVGESGCGKSTVGRTIMKLVEPTAGRIEAMGTDVTDLSPARMRPHRQRMQMVFQDPYSSLNPRMTAARIVAEPLEIHGMSAPAREARLAELFDMVGLPRSATGKYAHEFSGGQRQHLAIARALAPDPRLLICDEAVSALDVSIQAQILNLLIDLQRDLGLAYLFITHDLSVVDYMADRVAVMYLGRIVEIGPREAIFTRPQHPYTQALVSAAPLPDPDADRSTRIMLKGEVPSPISPPAGCHFRTRCPKAMAVCSEVYPVWKESGQSRAACHLV